jgi:hypothetical protein
MMKGIINNIINFYDTETKVLNVLIANTQKTLNDLNREKKAAEPAERVENFVKDLTVDLNNMLTKFYFLKDRKDRKHEQMTDRQVKAVTEFAVFVKTLAGNVGSLLKRFQPDLTFEEKVDEEIRELEASVGRRLKGFDKALDETNSALAIHPIKFARNIAGSFADQLGNLFGRSSIKSVKSDEKRSKCLMQSKA